MTSAAIVTDSTSSLPEELYARYNIEMVPYYVHFADRVARDMVDIKPAEFNAYLASLPESASLPKTANPGPGDYLQAYEKAAQHSDAIFSFHMTSRGSGAFHSALVARDMALERLRHVRIEVIDTLNVSMCHGWITLQAARAAAAGASADDILGMVGKLIPVARMLQTADTLRYLYMGGRIGRAQHLIGSLLNIKPLISMEEGRIVALGVARTRLAAYRRMAALVERAVGPQGRIRLALTHAAAREDAALLSQLAGSVVQIVETLYCELCPALTVHSGPGTVGLCYIPELA